MTATIQTPSGSKMSTEELNEYGILSDEGYAPYMIDGDCRADLRPHGSLWEREAERAEARTIWGYPEVLVMTDAEDKHAVEAARTRVLDAADRAIADQCGLIRDAQSAGDPIGGLIDMLTLMLQARTLVVGAR